MAHEFERRYRSVEYRTWERMIRRCENQRTEAYPSYGGRGVVVCPAWRISFDQFLSDMGPRPGPGFTIERIDNDGNYEPSNCRWATTREQNRNTSRNTWLTAEGRRMLLADWARELGVPPQNLCYHLKEGRTMESIVLAHHEKRRLGRKEVKRRVRNRGE